MGDQVWDLLQESELPLQITSKSKYQITAGRVKEKPLEILHENLCYCYKECTYINLYQGKCIIKTWPENLMVVLMDLMG